MKFIIICLLFFTNGSYSCIEDSIVSKLNINTELYKEIDSGYNNGEESIIIPYEGNIFKIESALKGTFNIWFNDKQIICNDTMPLRIFEFQDFQSALFMETYLILGLKIRASGLASNLVGYFIFDIKEKQLNYLEGYYFSKYFVNDYNNDKVIDFIQLNLFKTIEGNYNVSPKLYILNNRHFVYFKNEEIESYIIKANTGDCK